MICHARIIVERIENNKTNTRGDILEWENFIRVGCPEMKGCKDALNGLLIKRDQYQKAISDPTTQERHGNYQVPGGKKGKNILIRIYRRLKRNAS